MKLETYLENQENVKNIAKKLISGIQVKDAVQLSKRVEYFRGRKLITAVTEKKALKKLKNIEVNSEEDAILIGKALLKHGFIHASNVKDRKLRELVPLRTSDFTESGYYTWIFQTSSFKRNLLLGLIIGGFLSLVMFPIWPQTVKTGTWYTSVTFLIAFCGLIFLRAVLFLLLWTVGFDFWIFPNLFDDEASVVESFLPIMTFEKGSTAFESWISRILFLIGLVLSGAYLYSQPTEFDEIMVIQRQFVSDLYEGKLLSNEEETFPEYEEDKMPDLDALLEEDEDDEINFDFEEEEVDKEL